ncbi:hypothetical protein FIBSPDRAFT_202076 [Athelia psychrophila]|uniref:Uncharacterized protein n=1 Tax=Athelia psychrophila TaxID=1759441 RepID=A0A165ZJ44_9AGAM|nr:hypothetical protein FIBSPDRAFT_202076 [Fibularhizoctonia sp. CBS 109695]
MANITPAGASGASRSPPFSLNHLKLGTDIVRVCRVLRGIVSPRLALLPRVFPRDCGLVVGGGAADLPGRVWDQGERQGQAAEGRDEDQGETQCTCELTNYQQRTESAEEVSKVQDAGFIWKRHLFVPAMYKQKHHRSRIETCTYRFQLSCNEVKLSTRGWASRALTI